MIEAWKVKIKAMASDWLADGRIDDKAAAEITFLLDRAEIVQWRQLIYVIHRDMVEARLIEVDLKDRASLEMEYKIEDLRAVEFDVIGP